MILNYDVLVIGGGNAALNDALYLSDIAKNVKIIYRKPFFTRAKAVVRERVLSKPNIECVYNTELKSIARADDSERLIATTTAGDKIECDGIFVASVVHGEINIKHFGCGNLFSFK